MTAPRATSERTTRVRPHLPAPHTAEGLLFHYTPEEAAQWTPFSARTLKNRIKSREIEFVCNGRDNYLTGRQIVALAERYVVKPFTAPKPARAVA